jgi:hypothetical protein
MTELKRGMMDEKRLHELVGQQCAILFDGPYADWPVKGYPAWVVIEAVESSTVTMRPLLGGPSVQADVLTIDRVWDERDPFLDSINQGASSKRP